MTSSRTVESPVMNPFEIVVSNCTVCGEAEHKTLDALAACIAALKKKEAPEEEGISSGASDRSDGNDRPLGTGEA